jgi:hypothetical protein
MLEFSTTWAQSIASATGIKTERPRGTRQEWSARVKLARWQGELFAADVGPPTASP